MAATLGKRKMRQHRLLPLKYEYGLAAPPKHYSGKLIWKVDGSLDVQRTGRQTCATTGELAKIYIGQ